MARAGLLSRNAPLLPNGGGKPKDSSDPEMSQEQKAESQVCTPEEFWCLFGKIWERATGVEDGERQHQPCGWGR